MGWSGEGIMDGDEPMDWEATIRDICGIGYDQHPDELPDFTEQVLYDHEDEIAALCERVDDSVAFEVWGQMLVDAKSASLRDDRRREILCRINIDIEGTPDQGWSDPENRLFHLRQLYAQVEFIGTGKVVDIQSLVLKRMTDRVTAAMQGAFDGIEDPSVAQRAVVRFLEDLDNGDSLDDWGYAAQAIVNVGKALAEARNAGVSIDTCVEKSRNLIGC